MTTVQTKQKITLYGNDIKKIKSMIKGWKRSSLESGNYIKFDVTENLVTATYIDYKRSLFVQLKIDVSDINDIFSFTFPIDILKTMSTKKNSIHEIQFDNTDNTVTYIEDGISQQFVTLDFNDFKEIDQDKNNSHIYIDLTSDDIKKIKDAFVSVSNSDTRLILKNVCLRNNKIISTDSRRLYMSKGSFDVNEDYLIPDYIVQLLNSITDKSDNLTITKNKNDFYRIFNDKLLVMYNVFGKYPEIDRLIPQDFNLSIEVKDTNKFKKALETIKKGKVFNNLTCIEFDYSNSTMRVYNDTLNINTNIDVTVNYKSSDFSKVSFNAAYVLDAFKQLDNDDQVIMNFVSPNQPFIVKSKRNDDTIALILPIRLPE